MRTKEQELILGCEKECHVAFEAIEERKYRNQSKVIDAFRAERIESRHFAGSTGYGYGDIGREALARVFARALGAESALVSPHILSGTHALSLCLYGLLRPQQSMLCATGAPYDTLAETIGSAGESAQSLKALGIGYRQVELTPEGAIDLDAIRKILNEHPDISLVYLQRSRGYQWRNALSVSEIEKAIRLVKELRGGLPVMIDNCYGEFVEDREPTEAGADVIVGSLIKNAGGGLASTGAYIAGTAACMDQIQYRLTAPGIGAEIGSWPEGYRDFFQGLFLAPHVVGESLKGAILASAVMEKLGYEVFPGPNALRSDIIQSIKFGSKEKLLRFCAAIQASSPVDSHLIPEPWAMPGYQHDIVMAAGTFVQGASIELSADAPIKPPYIAYMQGGLTYEHCKYAIERVAENLLSLT